VSSKGERKKETVTGTPLNAELRYGRSGTVRLLGEQSASEHPFSYLSIMAARIVSWGGNEKIVSPGLSKTPSMVSFDSLRSDNSETPPAIEAAPMQLSLGLSIRVPK